LAQTGCFDDMPEKSYQASGGHACFIDGGSPLGSDFDRSSSVLRSEDHQEGKPIKQQSREAAYLGGTVGSRGFFDAQGHAAETDGSDADAPHAQSHQVRYTSGGVVHLKRCRLLLVERQWKKHPAGSKDRKKHKRAHDQVRAAGQIRSPRRRVYEGWPPPPYRSAPGPERSPQQRTGSRSWRTPGTTNENLAYSARSLHQS